MLPIQGMLLCSQKCNRDHGAVVSRSRLRGLLHDNVKLAFHEHLNRVPGILSDKAFRDPREAKGYSGLPGNTPQQDPWVVEPTQTTDSIDAIGGLFSLVVHEAVSPALSQLICGSLARKDIAEKAARVVQRLRDFRAQITDLGECS